LVGLTGGEIPFGRWIGQSPNSYTIGICTPNCNFYQFLRLAGQRHLIEFPDEVFKDTGNVVGCGLLINPDDKLTIFFTFNGIMIGSLLIFPSHIFT
jgi:hypothetical protein